MQTLAFYFEELLLTIVWAVLFVLNLWIWQKGKAQSSLLMMIGSAVLTLGALLFAFTGTVEVGNQSFQKPPDDFVLHWLPIIGGAIFVGGFYLSVKTQVAGHIAALKAKLGPATSDETPEEAKKEE